MARLFTITILAALVMLGCETEPRIFTGPYYARFTETALTKKESYSPVIPISVHIASPATEESVSINYEISGSAREGIDYVIQGTRGVVTIEKGKFFGIINVKLINNANNILRSQDLVLTLTSTNQSSIRISQNDGGIGKKFTLRIQDDCLLGGEYTVARGSGTEVVTITSQDCEKYVLSNWNINVFSNTTPMDLIFTDNIDNTLTIPEQEEENISKDFATIKGTGIFDPVTNKITLTITLVDFEDQPKVTLNLTRN